MQHRIESDFPPQLDSGEPGWAAHEDHVLVVLDLDLQRTRKKPAHGLLDFPGLVEGIADQQAPGCEPVPGQLMPG